MRNLVEQLPRLRLDQAREVDLQTSEPALLTAIAEDSESVMRVVQSGLGAIGHLLSHSAVDIEDGTISADCIESLGFLMAELGDLASACMTLAAECRRASAASASSPAPAA
jgi:hypothetical protein